MRDRHLESLEAVIERQQRVTPEGDDDRLVFQRQHRGMWLLWSRRQISHAAPLLPLRNRLLVDAIALRENPQALLTMLYRSTDRRSRRGAPVVNLAHSAS